MDTEELCGTPLKFRASCSGSVLSSDPSERSPDQNWCLEACHDKMVINAMVTTNAVVNFLGHANGRR